MGGGLAGQKVRRDVTNVFFCFLFEGFSYKVPLIEKYLFYSRNQKGHILLVSFLRLFKL